MIEETERRDIERSDRKWSEGLWGNLQRALITSVGSVVLPRRFHGYEVLILLSQ